MAAIQSVDAARALLGDDVLGPVDIEQAFGATAGTAIDAIPFTAQDLERARDAGEMLVLRVAQAPVGTPLTIVQMIQRYPQSFDSRFLRKVGYQLKDEWGIELEPCATTDTCSNGWALVRKTVLDDSLNLAYEEQDTAMARYARQLGVAATAIRRRTAVEIVYDTLLYFTTRKVRLLEKTWDWSATRTVDGGYLNAGGFATNGMQVLSYSRAVRHGALGVCPTRQATR
jgi:hypothetical protein